MAQRRHHYEFAFEQYLRSRRVPYVAVDEAHRALLPPDPSRSPGPAGLKSFDFVLYGEDLNLLVEIKGRRVARRTAEGRRRGPGRLESWVTEDDVRSLQTWERLFGDGFCAAFVFVYWCDDLPPTALFEEIFEVRGRWYAIRAVRLELYAGAMRTRSGKWGTVDLSGADFDRISRRLCPPDSDAPDQGPGALHRAPAVVASSR